MSDVRVIAHLRGELSIMLRICCCVHRNRFSHSAVSVHDGHTHSTVGATVSRNRLKAPRIEYNVVVGSRFSTKKLPMLLLSGSPLESVQPGGK